MDDAILYWNDIALEANRVSHSNGKMEQDGPPRSARALALVHLAMYDAFVGAAAVSGAESPGAHYLPAADLPAAPPAGASVDAAVAAAAYAVLFDLFPSQRPFFDLIYDPTYSPVGVAAAGAADGQAYGAAVADKLLKKRMNDPGASPLDYKPQTGRGKHRPDPDNPTQSFHAPRYGAESTLFATTERFQLAAPPATSTGPGDYRRALRQVRGKGIAPGLMGTVTPASRRRDENETIIGLYWAYDGAFGLGTPPRLYNQILRLVAKNHPHSGPGGAINTPAQNARLFALVNVAMADAGILAWEQKYRPDFEFWRPVVGIREHDPSMGPEATPGSVLDPDCDAGWLPLGAPLTNRLGKNFTPPFPAYPSGHATFGGAAFHVARRFYGVAANDRSPDDLFKKADGTNLSFVSEELNGVNTDNKGAIRPRHVREFDDGLWTMIVENGLSRIYLGVHWSFDAFALTNAGAPDIDEEVGGLKIGGVPLGIDIANDIFDSGMLAANGAPPAPAMLARAAAAPAVNLSADSTRLPWPLG